MGKTRLITVMGATVACLLALVASSALPSTWHIEPPQWTLPTLSMAPLPPVEAPSSAPMADIPHPDTAIGRTILTVLSIIIGLAVAALIIYAVTRLVKALSQARLDTTAPPDSLDHELAGSAVSIPAHHLRAAIDDALLRLDSIQVPRDAVIAAWVTLEQEALAHGVGREPAWTPTEFIMALLESTSAPSQATTTLKDLYLKARFSDLTTTPADRQSARQSLVSISKALEET